MVVIQGRLHKVSELGGLIGTNGRQILVIKGGMFTRRATFVLSILSLAPGLSSPWEVPQVDHTRLQTFRARHLASAEI